MRTHVDDDEVSAKFFSRLMMLVNQMKSCGEKITEVQKVEKVLRSLIENFDYIVVDI